MMRMIANWCEVLCAEQLAVVNLSEVSFPRLSFRNAFLCFVQSWLLYFGHCKCWPFIVQRQSQCDVE